MAKRDKRIAAMRQNPRHVSPADLDTALTGLGFTADQTGSHKTYRHSGLKITVPQRKHHLKPRFVLDALALIDELGLLGEEENE